MNDILQQLLQFGPGIAAGAKGNGPGMAAFMEAYQRTTAQLDEQERGKQRDSFAMQDRERSITRQQEQDRIAAEQRTNATTQQTQADALQRMQIPGQLAQVGGAAESPQDAQRLIESLMPDLMKAFGQDTMAYGQPAVEMATRTITARQKRQVSEFVEQALKTSFVADNPEADPEIANLPAHVVKALGKPTAKLSELQQFAELPVGKPAGKTRIPPAAGSMEEFSDPTITPERKAQILADRKAYMQSDDRAPRVTVNTGDKVDKAAALKFQDDYARDSKPYIQLRDAYQRVKAAKPDAAGDLSLIFAYMKILDPNSVVREQEFANAQNAAGVPDRIRNLYNQVKEGVRLNPEQRRQFLAQADSLFENARTNQKQVRGTYSNRAKQWGIPENMVLDAEDPMLSAPPQATAPEIASSGPKAGERRKVNGVLAEWDGKGWLPVVK